MSSIPSLYLWSKANVNYAAVNKTGFHLHKCLANLFCPRNSLVSTCACAIFFYYYISFQVKHSFFNQLICVGSMGIVTYLHFSFLAQWWWQSGWQHHRDGEEILGGFCENVELHQLFHWEIMCVISVSCCTLSNPPTFKHCAPGSKEPLLREQKAAFRHVCRPQTALPLPTSIFFAGALGKDKNWH